MAKAAPEPVTELLTRLDAALAKHHPKLQRRLNKGASAAALAELEKVAGARLPEAFTAFLRWHDGAPSEIRVLDGMCWLDAKRCASIKAMMDGIIAVGHTRHGPKTSGGASAGCRSPTTRAATATSSWICAAASAGPPPPVADPTTPKRLP